MSIFLSLYLSRHVSMILTSACVQIASLVILQEHIFCNCVCTYNMMPFPTSEAKKKFTGMMLTHTHIELVLGVYSSNALIIRPKCKVTQASYVS